MKKCNDAGIWHKSQQGESEAYWTAFNSGKIAAFPGPSSSAAYYENNVNPDGNTGYGHLAMEKPMKFGTDGRETYINNTEYYAINKNTKHIEEARELIKYLALSEEAAVKFSNVNEDGVMAQFSTGSINGLHAVAEEPDTSDSWKAFGNVNIVSGLAQLLIETNPYIPNVDERSNEINTTISDVIGEMFLNGKYTPDEAAAEMLKRINNL